MANIAGAVNGVATVGVTSDGSDKAIAIADNGSPTTLDVKTDGNDWNELGVSSRVAIIGGTTAGRDHFPWPAQDGVAWDGTPLPASSAIGDETSHPLGISLATATKWLLRVKSWHIAIPAFHDGNDDTDYAAFEFDCTSLTDAASSVPITSEYQLVLPVPYNTGGIEDWTVDQRQQWGAAFFIGLFDPDQSGLYFNSDLFYPSIVLRINVWTGDPTEPAPGDLEDHGHLVFVTAPANAGFPTDWSLVGTAVIDGQSFGVFKKHAGTTLSSNIVITPTSYWPYAAKDSSPIYDTSDGSELQSPLN